MPWIANLSDGSTIVEQKKEEGGPTPWRRLLIHCKENNLQVTGLRLVVNNVTVNALPPKACDGYFQAYEVMKMIFKGTSRHRQGIGSVVGDKVYIMWVDLNQENNNMNYVNSQVIDLEKVKTHTTVD